VQAATVRQAAGRLGIDHHRDREGTRHAEATVGRLMGVALGGRTVNLVHPVARSRIVRLPCAVVRLVRGPSSDTPGSE
jgi:hypothetical protein